MFDVNLKNPEGFDDFISLINSYYDHIEVDDVIFLNHETKQNTPELLIHVVKSEYCHYHNYGVNKYRDLL